jgi:hypothetical protein
LAQEILLSAITTIDTQRQAIARIIDTPVRWSGGTNSHGVKHQATVRELNQALRDLGTANEDTVAVLLVHAKTVAGALGAIAEMRKQFAGSPEVNAEPEPMLRGEALALFKDGPPDSPHRPQQMVADRAADRDIFTGEKKRQDMTTESTSTPSSTPSPQGGATMSLQQDEEYRQAYPAPTKDGAYDHEVDQKTSRPGPQRAARTSSHLVRSRRRSRSPSRRSRSSARRAIRSRSPCRRFR